jgi:hypothetical protein
MTTRMMQKVKVKTQRRGKLRLQKMQNLILRKLFPKSARIQTATKMKRKR